jgi:kynurenine formamidase
MNPSMISPRQGGVKGPVVRFRFYVARPAPPRCECRPQGRHARLSRQPAVRNDSGQTRRERRLVEQLAAGHGHAHRHTRRRPAALLRRPGVESLPLDLLIGQARVIDIPAHGGVTEAHLADCGLREDLRVLIRTPNSALWNTAEGFRSDYTYLTEGGAKFLVDHGVKLVGVDYLSVEQFKKAGAPAHHMLLGHGVIIIEGLNLTEAEPGAYEMYCLPLRIDGADGAPARVILKR